MRAKGTRVPVFSFFRDASALPYDFRGGFSHHAKENSFSVSLVRGYKTRPSRKEGLVDIVTGEDQRERERTPYEIHVYVFRSARYYVNDLVKRNVK